MKYKYIHFILAELKPKTAIWSCHNSKSDDLLGHVRWHGPWRQYCYFTTNNAIYNSGCLNDITQFLDWVNTKHKEKRNNE